MDYTPEDYKVASQKWVAKTLWGEDGESPGTSVSAYLPTVCVMKSSFASVPEAKSATVKELTALYNGLLKKLKGEEGQ